MSLYSETIPCPHCRRSLQSPSLEALGTTIACPHCGEFFTYQIPFERYTIEKKIGSGGNGIVFQAADPTAPTAQQKVAIKVLDERHSRDAHFIETFLNEVNIMAALHHPNIVQVFRTGHCDSQYFIAMEYIHGGTLENQIIERTTIPEAEALDIGIGIASALRFALGRGLIHRDIKPGNILYDGHQIPKLVDFGLCREASALPEETGQVYGTCDYVPPERLTRDRENFHSDMYSLGATLYHALAGRPPYGDSTPQTIIGLHQAGPPPSIRAVAPLLSDATIGIIDRTVAPKPGDRFPSYDVLLQHLSQAREMLSWHGVPPPPPKESFWKNPKVVFVLGVAKKLFWFGVTIGIIWLVFELFKIVLSGQGSLG